MTAENSYGDYTEELEKPIKIRLTGSLRNNLRMDYEGTAKGRMFGEDPFQDDPMLEIFRDYKTRVIIQTKGQASDLLHHVCCGVLGGRISYDNPQIQKAGKRVRETLKDELLEQGESEMVDQYYDDTVVTRL